MRGPKITFHLGSERLEVEGGADVQIRPHGPGCGVAHFADIQMGMQARLVVVDRVVVWLALPEFNFMIGGHAEFIARYQFMTGIGVTFP